MRALGYTRVSTKGQDPGPQLERIRDYAAIHKFELVDVVVETASARGQVRPGYERVMAAARGHHVHHVLTPKLDRWTRSLKQLAGSVEELLELGVPLHFVDQGLVLRKDDPSSKLMVHVLGLVAEWEGDIISERTKDALRRKPPGQGPGRHRVGCGHKFRCPTGFHGNVRPNGPLVQFEKGGPTAPGGGDGAEEGVPASTENGRFPEAS